MNRRRKASLWKANGLSIVLLSIFLSCLVGQFVAGRAAWNDELSRKGEPALTPTEYFESGHFVGATFENWESEFLQMGMYVLLTVWLRQRGSAESRPMNPADEEQEIREGPKPWPVRAGGIWRTLYSHSLSSALFFLFALSFGFHALGSVAHQNAERRMEGLPAVTLSEHLRGAEFWFESLQNWQSEFLAVLALVLLSIVLRQDRSPQSKPVDAPHSQTGT